MWISAQQYVIGAPSVISRFMSLCMDYVLTESYLFITFQTLVLRDWWLCTVLSVMFEVLEYTLEHQLPNFSECWWDHVRFVCLLASCLYICVIVCLRCLMADLVMLVLLSYSTLSLAVHFMSQC